MANDYSPVHSLFRLLATLLLTAGLMSSGPAFAISLGDAKAKGYVGEQLDGYLGVVSSGVPAEAHTLVKNVNAKRKAQYQKIAKRNGISVSDVGKLTAEKVIKKAKPGHYVQNASGKWVKR